MRKYVASALYLFLALVLCWRGVQSWPRADSYNRVGDTALISATQKLSTPLPPQSRLFAAVDDALALQYLIHIWQLRPDLAVVSSPIAAEQIVKGNAVYSTWEATPTLHAELSAALPADHPYSRLAIDPNWIRFQPAIVSPAPAIDETITGTVVNAAITSTVTLARYAIDREDAALPPTQRRPMAITVTLFWQLTDNAAWPDDLSISVRLTNDGVPIAGAQQDRSLPVFGLSEPQAGFWQDPYRFQAGRTATDTEDLTMDATTGPTMDFSEADLRASNGIMVILYRPLADGFENVAVLTYPLDESN